MRTSRLKSTKPHFSEYVHRPLPFFSRFHLSQALRAETHVEAPFMTLFGRTVRPPLCVLGEEAEAEAVEVYIRIIIMQLLSTRVDNM